MLSCLSVTVSTLVKKFLAYNLVNMACKDPYYIKHYHLCAHALTKSLTKDNKIEFNKFCLALKKDMDISIILVLLLTQHSFSTNIILNFTTRRL